MSQVQLELLKILLDKGLLAIILVCVGYYLNRAIEKYKAKNIYFQNVSQARIQAYRDVSKVLSKEFFQLQKVKHQILSYHKAIEKYPERKEKEENQNSILLEMKSDLLKMKDENQENIIILSMNSIFFSPEVRKAITECFSRFSDVLDLETNLFSNEDSQKNELLFTKIENGHENLMESFSALYMKLQDDIRISPFD